jgi:uncharacterized membrane protein YkoI
MPRFLSHGLAAALIVAVALAAAPVRADDGDDDDHDEARTLVEAGIIRPLPEILAGLALTGRLIEVELDEDDGRWVYELTILHPGGRLQELEVDAVSGALIEDD